MEGLVFDPISIAKFMAIVARFVTLKSPDRGALGKKD